MRRATVMLAAIALLVMTAAPAFAQSGHFLTGGRNAPTCTDIGTQVECTGKVAGLGGTTFTITIEAHGIAEVVCINPAGHRSGPGHRGDRGRKHWSAADTTQRAGQVHHHH